MIGEELLGIFARGEGLIELVVSQQQKIAGCGRLHDFRIFADKFFKFRGIVVGNMLDHLVNDGVVLTRFEPA